MSLVFKIPLGEDSKCNKTANLKIRIQKTINNYKNVSLFLSVTAPSPVVSQEINELLVTEAELGEPIEIEVSNANFEEQLGLINSCLKIQRPNFTV